MHYIFLIAALIFNAVANILMKAGMRNAPAVTDTMSTIKHYLTSWPLLLGIVLFAINILAYTQALSKIPISVAYPIMAGTGFAIISAAGYFLFSEKLSSIQIIGIVCILIGIILVARQSPVI